MSAQRFRKYGVSFRQGCEIIDAQFVVGFDGDEPLLRFVTNPVARAATQTEIGPAASECRPVDIAAPPTNCGCRGEKTNHWLGCRWQGRPWPLRWRWRWPHLLYVDEPGCGCIIKLKAFWQVARNLRRGLREASRA